jgi:hypothetical protein
MAQVKSTTGFRLTPLGASISLSIASHWLYPCTSVEVSALALLTSTLVAGFIGWIAFLVDGSDSEQKQTMGALRLGQEQAGRLAQPD